MHPVCNCVQAPCNCMSHDNAGSLPVNPPKLPPVPGVAPAGYQYELTSDFNWTLVPIYTASHGPQKYTMRRPPVLYNGSQTIGGFVTNNKPLIYLGVGAIALYFWSKS